MQQVSYANTIEAADAASSLMLRVYAYLSAVNRAKEQPLASVEPSPTGPPTPLPEPVVTAETSSQCGGDLPPCYVMQRESGGQANAVNPTGCGGRGCYGLWQFDPTTWDSTANAMGRPDLVGNYLPSVDDQNAVARFLYAGGAGAGHWACC